VFSDMHAVLAAYPKQVFCSVGDVVTEQLFSAQAPWFLAVIDGYTKRSPYHISIPTDVTAVIVDNPPGCISSDLIDAIQCAMSVSFVSPCSSKLIRTLIKVNGEEDLALLPLLLAAPKDTVLLYGQPDEGIVALVVNSKSRSLAHEYLGYFVEQ
jgi:uncharacterized protein (UPF0218 family)